MKKICNILFAVAAFLLLSMAPSRNPVNRSLDPSLKVFDDILDDSSGFYFMVWRSSNMGPYDKYSMTVVSSANDKDTMVVVANRNGSARYILTDMDKGKEVALSILLKDEAGKVICAGTSVCEEGRVVSMSFDMKPPKTKKTK